MTPKILRANIAANYASQAFVAAAGILTVPIYLRFMGAETYGLIGFYTLLQAWFMLLDAGLTAALARQSSLYNGGSGNAPTLVQLKRLLEIVFAVVGTAGALAFLLMARPIALDWLRVGALDPMVVTRSIMMMGLIVAFRWQTCLYRGAITGFERQVWLGGANAFIAALRFLGCIPVMAFYDAGPLTFFAYQIGVSLIEMLLMRWKSFGLMPDIARPYRYDWPALRPILSFSAGIAVTSIVWVLVTQSDKLILSRLLPLADYGHFSLAVQLATGITLINTPFTTAILPNMTRMHANGDGEALKRLFRRSTQLITLAIAPPAVVLMCLGREVLFAWTGDSAIAASVAPVLGLYAVGNALLAVTALGYYIQYAHGDVRLHIRGNLLFALLYLPALYYAVTVAGAVGAGWCWLAMNLLYLLLWLPLILKRLLGGGYLTWITADVGIIVVCAGIPALGLLLYHPPTSRFGGLALAIAFGFASLVSGLLASSFLRAHVMVRWQTLLLRVRGA